MAKLQEDRRSYSTTLERLRDDETLSSPQALGPATIVDFHNNPGLDGANSAPEVLPGTSSEILHSNLPPEAIDVVGTSQDPVSHNVKSRRWIKWVLAVSALMVAVALVIGLKVGLQKKNRASSVSSSKSANASIEQQILSDSSLAATVAANGDRHLFFQTPQGAIRRMIYTVNEDQWITDPVPIAISDAKILTPMAVSTQKVLNISSEQYSSYSNKLELYYISSSNQLNTSVFNGEAWYPGKDLSSNYTTAPDTRQLSITSSSEANNTQGLPKNGTVNQSLLLYEDSDGNVAALLQVQRLCPVINLTATNDCINQGPGSTDFGLYWLDVTKINHSIPRSDFSPVDFNSSYDPLLHASTGGSLIISSTLYESRPEARLSTPFTSGASAYTHGSALSVDLLICDDGTDEQSTKKRQVSSCNNVTWTTYQSWTNASHGFFESEGILLQSLPPDVDTNSYPSIEDSDLAIVDFGAFPFAIWINGTNPSVLGYGGVDGPDIAPNVSFPFKRLASITLPDQKTSYLYHQINGTTLVEEHYDNSLSEWLSTYIIIPNP